MLQPRLTTCSECAEISTLLCKIDCKLAKLGTILYGNLTLMLNRFISADTMIDLLNYKRILTFKQVNPDYCEDYTLDMIASKVRRLTVGAVCIPCECIDYATTTTTTTALITTTTTIRPTTPTTTTTTIVPDSPV
jgi:hypothetical protein